MIALDEACKVEVFRKGAAPDDPPWYVFRSLDALERWYEGLADKSELARVQYRGSSSMVVQMGYRRHSGYPDVTIQADSYWLIISASDVPELLLVCDQVLRGAEQFADATEGDDPSTIKLPLNEKEPPRRRRASQPRPSHLRLVTPSDDAS